MGEIIDLLIKGGKVYDGTGNEPFIADIGIVKDRIAFVGRSASEYGGGAVNVIRAEGLSVSPGFIDTHGHSEFTLLADGRAEGKVLQGVTTEINGNCGLSAAPLLNEALAHREADLCEWEIKERWSTFREYFDLLEERGIALNYATLTGHGNLRASVVGYADRQPSDAEMKRMCDLLEETVRDGSLGLSTGLIYPPGVYARTEELVGLAHTIPDRLYATHMRSEGDALIEAIEEALSIGRGSGIAVHLSHLKTGGKENWHKGDQAIAVIANALSGGVKISADRYPYTAASTDLDAVLPSWVYAGGTEEELRRLEDEEIRRQIKGELLERYPSDVYWDSITVASVTRQENAWMEGKSMSRISVSIGKEPVDFLFHLLIEERLRVGAIFHTMNEENLRRFLSLPYTMIGSDSSARSFDGPTRKGKPHPRGFGSFPRFLGSYVRDEGLMALAEGIRRATMLPADTFGLKNRGRLKEGYAADLVVFDEEAISDRATFDAPFTKPVGIDYVVVNGVPTLWKGVGTGARAGRVLRNGL